LYLICIYFLLIYLNGFDARYTYEREYFSVFLRRFVK